MFDLIKASLLIDIITTIFLMFVIGMGILIYKKGVKK